MTPFLIFTLVLLIEAVVFFDLVRGFKALRDRRRARGLSVLQTMRMFYLSRLLRPIVGAIVCHQRNSLRVIAALATFPAALCATAVSASPELTLLVSVMACAFFCFFL